MNSWFGWNCSHNPHQLTRVLQHCDLLRTVGAQQDLCSLSPILCWARKDRSRNDVTKYGRGLHHVIALEHGHAGETLVHDVGRVLTKNKRDQNRSFELWGDCEWILLCHRLHGQSVSFLNKTSCSPPKSTEIKRQCGKTNKCWVLIDISCVANLLLH